MIRNNINDKLYVGRAVNLRKRWTQHRHHLRSNTHHCRTLQNAWNKYSELAFSFVVLVGNVNSEECLCSIEQYYIDNYKCLDRMFGYNLSPSSRSNRGVKYTLESRLKMSLAQTGRVVSDEGRKNISKALTGKKQSAETVAKRVEKIRGLKRTEAQIETLRMVQFALSQSKKLFAFGEEKFLTEWAKEYKINTATLRNRIVRSGMGIEEALLAPPHRGHRKDLRGHRDKRKY